MQSAVMEFARNVCGMEGATSSEFDEDAKYKVIDLSLIHICFFVAID